MNVDARRATRGPLITAAVLSHNFQSAHRCAVALGLTVGDIASLSLFSLSSSFLLFYLFPTREFLPVVGPIADAAPLAGRWQLLGGLSRFHAAC